MKIAPVQSHTVAQRRWRNTGRGFGVGLCLVFMAGGTVFGHFYRNSSAFRRLMNNHAGSMLTGIFTNNPLQDFTPERQFSDRTSMNVLILGCDHDYDDHDRIVKTTHGRSDSIMLARFDFVSKRIEALTIPRDTAVRIPGYRGIHKINAAHNLGGPELTVETVKSVFGVEADAVVTLNFEGFQQIVDSLGGIDVNVEKKLDYDDNWGNLHIHLKPGYQHLTGYKAMGYVRMRHSDSDEMRSKRQHAFLEAMRSKIKSPSSFMSLPHVIDNLADNLKRTNLTEDQLITIVNFARTLPKENINIETLPSFEGPSYVTVNAEKSAATIERMFFPNQTVALNIDAPDPNFVRSMNAPYERGGAGRRHGKKGSKADKKQGDAVVVPPTGELSVESPPVSDKPGTGSETEKPAPPVSTPDAGSKEGTDKSDKSDKKDATEKKDTPSPIGKTG